ncbi:MAG: dTDP-6-deoxy-3,4-keto-hexulose isomerase [Methylophaga sp.]|nr:MAG: dTDP-6-deoxy-3,4-keto-hexulose isomerase [Methylophaga sp.]
MNLIKTISFPLLGDERGSLVALEANTGVPFDIKRVYYLFDTKNGVSRGFHAHKKLQQIAICVKGSCRFLLDDGVEKQEIVLDSPTTGLLIEDMIWHEMYDFTPDCVLMVLADQHYDESDYIRNYQEFLRGAN